MTPKDKFKKLVELLYARTLERKIEWKHDEEYGVWAHVGGRTIELSSSSNENLEPLEVIRLVDRNRVVIEAFDDDLFSGGKPDVHGDFQNYWQVMSSTREMAYRQAIGADEAIDDILSALDDDVPF